MLMLFEDRGMMGSDGLQDFLHLVMGIAVEFAPSTSRKMRAIAVFPIIVGTIVAASECRFAASPRCRSHDLWAPI